MPRRRVRDSAQRRLGRPARDRIRAVRAVDELINELPYETSLRETALRHQATMAPDRPELATVHELNPPPVFGPTYVLAAGGDFPCASCPSRVQVGDEVTEIDGQLNCAECTEEARRG